jgi:hypothetical protein
MITGARKGAVNPTDATADGVTVIEMPWSPIVAETIEALARSSNAFAALWRVGMSRATRRPRLSVPSHSRARRAGASCST